MLAALSQGKSEAEPFYVNSPPDVCASYNSRMTRRALFKDAAGVAGAILFDCGLFRIADAANMIPSVYGQTQTSGRIIQVGIEQYPVDFESPISKDEYDKDTIDNVYSPLIGRKTIGHLYVKRDSEFTKFIADFPTSVSNPNGYGFGLFFDTKNSNKFALGSEGVYTLRIRSTSSSPPTEIPDPVSGIPFSRDYHKGVDYDWRYFFAPSPLSSKPHVQVKAEFKTDIILRSDNASREIIFYSGENDANGVVEIPWKTKLRFVDQTVAEPFGAGTILVSLAGTAYVVRKLSRRSLLKSAIKST
jgi:hypothetical protein